MAKKRESGLGRGLDALMGGGPSSLLEQSEGSGITTLPIAKVEANTSQPRKQFDPDALSDLAESIATHGILQPITVRRLPSGYYQIISGERRWRAARQAGLNEVPVLVIEADDRKVMELSLIENLQREDLNPMEEAAGFQSLIETYHMTQEEAAQRVGKSRSAVTNALRLLGLSPSVRKLVEENKLTAGHARALVPLSPSLQESAANAIIAGGLSVRQTEALVKRLSAEKKESKKPRNDEVDYLAEAQNELKAKLCRGVKIVSGRKKGRIELEYYGLDDLNDLLDALALIKINKAKEGPQA
ncbi:MAG: ParB/RepB/Spo0J family partition protein [Oscillibacter sp.]|nr:ParB/RepB/Spo0J family partition protein [Oscillibacter sp.]